MFTGIVAGMGMVRSLIAPDDDSGSVGLVVDAGITILNGLHVGGSVAVNGCCLTATKVTDSGFEVTVVSESLSLTNLGQLQAGNLVNLERPMAADGRFDGHIVQGHVDGTATVVQAAPNLILHCDPGLLRYVVHKGSITLDGVSLTVASVDGPEFAVAVIPHTADATTLGNRQPGDLVNVEVDILAKYVERLMGDLRR